MPSKRHHYIPKFHIKEFVNSNNKVVVFDKHTGEFKKIEFSPKQVFYEWNRNTLDIENKKDYFIEDLYAKFETKLSPAYTKIKEQKGIIRYTSYDMFSLLLLVSLTHWRLPLNDIEAELFVKNTPKDNLLFRIFNKETEEEVDEEFYKKIKERNGFVEMYKLAKPIMDFKLLDIKNCISNWQIYSTDSEVKMHILGDNPIIFKNKPSDNVLETELIFPLTKGSTLHNNSGKRIKQIPPELKVKMDIIQFLQSNQYVVGPNKSYLNTIKILSQGYTNKERIELLRNEIFDTFKEHSD